MNWPRRMFKTLGLLLLLALPSITQVGGNGFVNFEAAFTNPIRLSADGSRLFCVNNPNGTVSAFDLSNPTAPALLAEIPVGVEPVSVNPRTDDEVWVVNQESDSVSIASVSKGIVTDTINVPDEPADVVFAGNYAFVSVARSNLINVYNVASHALAKSIPVFGGAPRALAVSPDGSTVYAAFALSGNGTTSIPNNLAPPPPPPTNPLLPPPPQQAIIVAWNDPAWRSVINYSMPDNDVVAIDASRLSVSKYYSSVGTNNLGIAVQPSTGDLFVSNTDALNLVRFQPNLDGHFVNNRISKITPAGTVTAYDLNPTVKYTGLPDPGSLQVALAQPAAVVFDGTGQNMYVAAFGTDRVARVDSNGNVLTRIEINPQETGATVAPETKRGPRGLAINNTTNKLYVFNRISNTFSIVDTSSDTVVTYDIPTGMEDPTPAAIQSGRGFLYDAKLSGNGTGACAACHLDAETDHLAWDLGDPGGSMQTVTLGNGQTAQEHPMKGAMTTLTLRGLLNAAPYHWRGDKATFADFNEAFQQLMGGTQLSTTDMQSYTNFINTVTFMPNPNQNLDRSYPTNENGNAAIGLIDFNTIQASTSTCVSCHSMTNYFGSNLQIQIVQGVPQPLKVPLLRAVYQKQLFIPGGQTIDGFGLDNAGNQSTTLEFVSQAGAFPGLKNNTKAKNDLAQFLLAFDTGMAPAVGYTRTLTQTNVTSSSVTSDWKTLESQASATNCDLIAQGTVNGVVTALLYSPLNSNYQAGQAGATYSHSQLVALVQQGDTLSIMGVPQGSGSRIVQ